jgi:putative oxidoreductase
MFDLTPLTDPGLLFLRIMAGAIFADSGYNHIKDPDARSKSLGLPKSVTIFLAVAELAGGAGIILGVLQQLAAIGLIVIMLGAIQKNMLLVILFTDGGGFVLMR